MPSKNSANEQLQNEIDDACTSVGALCDLLAAAQHAQVSAASIHALLWPVARKLDLAAGAVADLATIAKSS
jgi:hypothetical protein